MVFFLGREGGRVGGRRGRRGRRGRARMRNRREGHKEKEVGVAYLCKIWFKIDGS